MSRNKFVRMRLTRPAVLDGQLYDIGSIVKVRPASAWRMWRHRAGVWTRRATEIRSEQR